MSQRVNKAMLQRKVNRVGIMLDIPTTPVSAPKGSKNLYKSDWLGLHNGGSGTYEPVLFRKNGGESQIFPSITGHVPARECYDYLRGFADGYEMARKGRR